MIVAGTALFTGADGGRGGGRAARGSLAQALQGDL
jgi:hypothetical protein